MCVVEHGPCVVHGQCMDARGGKTKFHMEGNGRQLVLRVLEAVSMKLSNTRVHWWFSDHQNVVRILHVVQGWMQENGMGSAKFIN